MIVKLIGLRRIVIIAGLLALNLLMLGSYMLGLDPMLQETEMQLHKVDGEISELTTKISSIKQDMSYLKENMPVYQDLRDRGLFVNQDRFLVNRVLGDMRKKNDLSPFSFSIEDIKNLPNDSADSIGQRLARSRVKIKINSEPLDSNIYLFMQELASSFSGYTYVKNFNIKRIGEVNEKTLKDISEGQKVGFLSADIAFDWLTLMPKPADQKKPEDASGGFRGR